MRIHNGNIKDLPTTSREQELLKALLVDLKDINNTKYREEIYIDWQDWHNEYSPERTDPCPDYYGYYTIRDASDPYNILGVEMTLDDLDANLCLLHNYLIKE